MRFFGSLIGIIVGVLLIWKTFPLVQTFGKVDWAEKHLSAGMGGTYFLYKLVGLAVIVLSLMYMFGILDALLLPFSGIFGGFNPQ